MDNLDNLEQRDRESPVLSGPVFYVSACDPKRRGRPALQLPDSRPDRTEVRRCPATRRSRGPRTTALRTARVAPDTSPLKGDVVAFGVAGVGIALQDERFFEAFSHCLARESDGGV